MLRYNFGNTRPCRNIRFRNLANIRIHVTFDDLFIQHADFLLYQWILCLQGEYDNEEHRQKSMEQISFSGIARRSFFDVLQVWQWGESSKIYKRGFWQILVYNHLVFMLPCVLQCKTDSFCEEVARNGDDFTLIGWHWLSELFQ